jgi:inner membrane protein
VFLAHVPAGYLAATAILRGQPLAPRARRRLLAWGMFAAVMPDLDLLWFYLVDERRQVHHAYLPHLPLAWVPVLAVAAVALAAARARRPAWLALALGAAGVASHLVLDTVAGGIRWRWPFSDAEFVLAHVPARFDPWVLNFVLHWTFALEIAIVAAAAWVAWRRRAVPG